MPEVEVEGRTETALRQLRHFLRSRPSPHVLRTPRNDTLIYMLRNTHNYLNEGVLTHEYDCKLHSS